MFELDRKDNKGMFRIDGHAVSAFNKEVTSALDHDAFIKALDIICKASDLI